MQLLTAINCSKVIKRTYLSSTPTIFDTDGLIIPSHIDRYDTITLQPGSGNLVVRTVEPKQ